MNKRKQDRERGARPSIDVAADADVLGLLLLGLRELARGAQGGTIKAADAFAVIDAVADLGYRMARGLSEGTAHVDDPP